MKWQEVKRVKLIKMMKNKWQQIQEKGQQEKQGIIKTMLGSSAHGILICTMLLATVSWAWFSETISAPAAKIQTAGYGIQAKVISGGDILVTYDYASVTNGDSFDIELAGGVVYDVELTGLGEASWNGGYCIVSAGDNVRYTERIYPGEELKFQVIIRGTDTGRIAFLPYWGYYPEDILEAVSDVQTSPKDIYRVQEDGKYVISDTGSGDSIKDIYRVENDGKYVVSDGDFIVSSGDNNSTVKATTNNDKP